MRRSRNIADTITGALRITSRWGLAAAALAGAVIAGGPTLAREAAQAQPQGTVRIATPHCSMDNSTHARVIEMEKRLSEPPRVRVVHLDAATDDGALLAESRELRRSLAELSARLDVMAQRAQLLGDGQMLGCLSQLEEETAALTEHNKGAYTLLLSSITEEDSAARLHGIHLTEAIRGRARVLDLREDDCLGVVDATYVDPISRAPVWEGDPLPQPAARR